MAQAVVSGLVVDAPTEPAKPVQELPCAERVNKLLRALRSDHANASIEHAVALVNELGEHYGKHAYATT